MENKKAYFEMDVIDLCKEVLKKWKLILVAMLVVAILFGIYGIVTMKKSNIDSKAEAAVLTSEMTSEEKKAVEDAAKIIQSYRTIYKSQKDYCDNSIFQNLNPYEIKSVSLYYYIDSGYKVSYPVIAEQNTVIPMIQMYSSVLKDESFYENLVKELNMGIDPTYLSEIITMSIGKTEDGDFSSDSGAFEVTFYADSDELLSNVSKYVKNAFEMKTVEVKELYGEHELILSSEVNRTVIDTTVATKQQANLDTLTKLTASIKDVENSFTGNQLLYLKFLIHEEVEETTNIFKCIVIGAIVGAAALVGFYVLKYLFTSTVKTEDELNVIVERDTLGKLTENVDFLALKIKNAIDKNNAKKVAVIVDEEDEDLIRITKKVNEDIDIAVNPLNSQESFEKLVSCDAAIIVAALKSSKVDDLFSIKSICENSQINILGTILK